MFYKRGQFDILGSDIQATLSFEEVLMRYKIGIDVGGTFTDFLLAHQDGTAEIYKVLYEKKDPKTAVRDLMTRSPKQEGLH